MKAMSTLLVILMVSVFSNLSMAQDFQGQAVYNSKTTVDLDKFGPPDMSEAQKKMMQERMKSFLEKTYELNFNRFESIYKEQEKLEAPGQGRGFAMMGSFTAGPQYKNVKDKQLLQEQEFFGKKFLINDSLPPLQWKMTSETKQIGQYTCFKATATKPVDDMDFRSMRPKRPENDEKKDAEKEADSTKSDDPFDQIEIPKEIEVVAWYTPQIPINQGPGEFWGLPGLILEVNADRTTILCSKIVLNPEDKIEIKKPTKGDEVSREEYNKIMTDKIKEMQEMYGGRGRGPGHR